MESLKFNWSNTANTYTNSSRKSTWKNKYYLTIASPFFSSSSSGKSGFSRNLAISASNSLVYFLSFCLNEVSALLFPLESVFLLSRSVHAPETQSSNSTRALTKNRGAIPLSSFCTTGAALVYAFCKSSNDANADEKSLILRWFLSVWSIPWSSSYRFSFVERTTRFVSSSSSLNYSTKFNSYYCILIL